MKAVKIFMGGLAAIAAAGYASASGAAQIISDVICTLVPDLLTLARVIAILFFIYGGAKYAFSADDPGGRKQGKQIAIHALIGFLIVAMSHSLVAAISGENVCP